MKKLIFVLLVCLVVTTFAGGKENKPQPEPAQPAVENTTPTPPEPQEPQPNVAPTVTSKPQGQQADAQRKVTVWVGDKQMELTMEEYLYGVLKAEMPASFPEEALKAQAVAARTYTIHKQWLYEKGAAPAESHKGAQMCSDYHHCKAYSLKSAEELWGKDAEFYEKKVKAAIAETDGIYMTYNAEPIVAVFHAASGPKTEKASDVWGGEYPYLNAVESPGGEHSPRYYGEVTVSLAEFQKKMAAAFGCNLEGDSTNWVKGYSRSESGGVQTVNIGGVDCKGTVMRTTFGLNSTNFEVKMGKTDVVFSTVGYGHGVGMSQYGARALALEGKRFDEILTWYYQGVTLEK